jgi:hypothetical protein
VTNDWVRQKRAAAPQRHEGLGPEPCPRLAAVVA